MLRHQRFIYREHSFSLSASLTQNCSLLNLSCGLLGLEFTDWEDLGHRPGEEHETPREQGRGGSQRTTAGREKGRLSRRKPGRFPHREGPWNQGSNRPGQRAAEEVWAGAAAHAQIFGCSKKPRKAVWRWGGGPRGGRGSTTAGASDGVGLSKLGGGRGVRVI